MLPISSTTIFGQLNAAYLGMFYFEQIFSLNTKTNYLYCQFRLFLFRITVNRTAFVKGEFALFANSPDRDDSIPSNKYANFARLEFVRSVSKFREWNRILCFPASFINGEITKDHVVIVQWVHVKRCLFCKAWRLILLIPQPIDFLTLL